MQSKAMFGFHDLHGFKDYVVYVQSYLPDRFPVHEWLGPDEQLTLELAFRGLREGLKLAVQEKGEKLVFTECERRVEEAYSAYVSGREREGFFKLEEVTKLLRRVPTQ